MAVKSNRTGRFTSFKGVTDYTRDVLNDATEKIAEHLMQKLEEYILQDIYGAYKPKWYQRTGDLLDAFELRYNNSYISDNFQIVLNDFKISYDDELFQHGNYFEEFAPRDFIRMLNGEIQQGDAFNFPKISREPFWNDFMNYAQSYVRKAYNEALIDAGLMKSIVKKNITKQYKIGK